jgi:tRNA(adenine34) deaminase
VSDADLERLLREAIALAAAARAAGRHPFGALVAAADGTVLARAGNESAAGEDPTAHAETVAIRRAAAAHGTAALAARCARAPSTGPGCRGWSTDCRSGA